jgi:hypothetical protein
MIEIFEEGKIQKLLRLPRLLEFIQRFIFSKGD